ncbi:hypothetical protein TWF730_000281 [Orbilia blumenaviensis]|uniref:Uncharacterized protein n=1 Tax=Orbilia blumenaviensis TaxID=1796055 RepID=A0AAV9VNB7_9PEZI
MPRAARGKKSGSSPAVPSAVPLGRTDSAVLITVSKAELQKYINREKKFLFKVNPWCDKVTKVWFYVKDPVKCITHVAIVGPMKKHGELQPLGPSNAAFNAGILNNGRHRYNAAYEITSLQKLSREMEFMYIASNGYTKPTSNGNMYVDLAMAEELDGVDTQRIF